ETKRCPSCKETKPITEYYKGVGRKKPIYCVPCLRIKDRSPNSRYSQGKTGAKRREVEWHLSKEEFLSILEKPCIYCNGPLPDTGLGIDRMSDGEGYTLKNSVPCCSVCNFIKHRS